MLIRLAIQEDATAWHALRLEALQANPESFGSSYDEERDMPLGNIAARLTDPLNRVWVAEENGELLGTATARREGMAKSAHRTNLFAMYVAPHVRQQGLGRQLAQAVINSARDDLETDWLQLSVTCDNLAACQLYIQLGFVNMGFQPDALRIDGQSFDEYHMVLDLRAATEALA
ncbi:GNAT family N-acetyltransferase [Chitinimonas sp. BJB300]|uniref:GNAT family N-acetyltransferase n=1 Tax=Chitinimonas sp. BJB300 TaxID=1559339 RepID=UPI000C0DB5A8|nr:GNAT family N-acetyltransferase [Chitinimonas sp. BJB300]PHV12303.1 GNAT family N-acetyltransferase [Chitinimonas sp. BJB300]TSJ88164.1 GNAT family N-acetyltransferase [Chitinimonas sp. BJB300]